MALADPPDSERLLAEALKQARDENKRVYLVESAGGSGRYQNCLACLCMARFLDRFKEAIDQDFVVLKLERRENSDVDPVIARVRAGKPGGIPWVAILDPDGAVLATGNDGSGKNLGFLKELNGIQLLMNMIKSNAPRLTPNQSQEMEATLMSKSIVMEVLKDKSERKRQQADQEKD